MRHAAFLVLKVPALEGGLPEILTYSLESDPFGLSMVGRANEAS